MSADQATHFFLYRDCLIRVSNHRLVHKAGSLLFAPHLPLREGKVNNGGPEGWAILDRIIHESSTHLKCDRTCIVGTTL